MLMERGNLDFTEQLWEKMRRSECWLGSILRMSINDTTSCNKDSVYNPFPDRCDFISGHNRLFEIGHQSCAVWAD